MSDDPRKHADIPSADTEREVDPDGLGEQRLRETIDHTEEEQGKPDPYDVNDRGEGDT